MAKNPLRPEVKLRKECTFQSYNPRSCVRHAWTSEKAVETKPRSLIPKTRPPAPRPSVYDAAFLDAATIVNRVFAFQDMESRVQELEAINAIVRQLISGPAFAADPSAGIFTTFITSLGSDEFCLKKPIPVTIFPDGDEFTASFMDANISTGGGSPQEAIYNLQHLIAEFFAMDEDEPEAAVSSKMRHQRLVLAECVCRNSPKTTLRK